MPNQELLEARVGLLAMPPESMLFESNRSGSNHRFPAAANPATMNSSASNSSVSRVLARAETMDNEVARSLLEMVTGRRHADTLQVWMPFSYLGCILANWYGTVAIPADITPVSLLAST